MQAKLLQHQNLIRKRKLLIDIHTLTFAPAVVQLDAADGENYPLCNAGNLANTIAELGDSDPTIFPALVAVIQAISTLRRGRKKRELRNAHSRGTKIKALEDS